MVWASGQSYDGDWRDDVPVGEGSMVFVNGDRFKGQVRDGIPEGRGKKQFANGDSYEGRSTTASPTAMVCIAGTAAATPASGRRASRRAVASTPGPAGKATRANGSTTGPRARDPGLRQRRPVRRGGQQRPPQGKGIKTYASQDRYEGGFAQGDTQGEGTRWKNGDAYTGSWQKGKKVGKGRYRWANGDYWEGEFADDKRTEAGRLYFTPKVAASGEEAPSSPARPTPWWVRPRPAPACTSRQAGERSLDRSKLLAIPMVAGNCAIARASKAATAQRGWSTMC